MLPKHHIVLGLSFVLVFWMIYPLGLFNASIIFFSSVLIDVDHYFLYIVKKKDFSLRRAYKYFVKLGGKEKRNKKRDSLPFWRKLNEDFIFHRAEFLVVIAILGIFIKAFWFMLIGLIFHLTMDFISMRGH